MSEKNFLKKSIVFFVFLIAAIATITPSMAFVSDAKTIYVDQKNSGGPWDGTIEHPYRTIQDAVLNANNGDIVFVFEGVYEDTTPILIDKSINLIGENKNNTLIYKFSIYEAIYVSADYSLISNFTIIHHDRTRPSYSMAVNANHVKIENINFYGLLLNIPQGLKVSDSNYCVINDCCFGDNHGFGIGLNVYNSMDNIVTNNTFYHCCPIAISMNNFTKNKFENNSIWGIGIGLSITDSSNNNVINKNRIESCQICIRLNNSNDNLITNNKFGGNILATFTDCRNGWNQNYWEKARIFPKLIFGTIHIGKIKMLSLNIDLEPAKIFID